MMISDLLMLTFDGEVSDDRNDTAIAYTMMIEICGAISHNKADSRHNENVKYFWFILVMHAIMNKPKNDCLICMGIGNASKWRSRFQTYYFSQVFRGDFAWYYRIWCAPPIALHQYLFLHTSLLHIIDLIRTRYASQASRNKARWKLSHCTQLKAARAATEFDM